MAGAVKCVRKYATLTSETHLNLPLSALCRLPSLQLLSVRGWFSEGGGTQAFTAQAAAAATSALAPCASRLGGLGGKLGPDPTDAPDTGSGSLTHFEMCLSSHEEMLRFLRVLRPLAGSPLAHSLQFLSVRELRADSLRELASLFPNIAHLSISARGPLSMYVGPPQQLLQQLLRLRKLSIWAGSLPKVSLPQSCACSAAVRLWQQSLHESAVSSSLPQVKLVKAFCNAVVAAAGGRRAERMIVETDMDIGNDFDPSPEEMHDWQLANAAMKRFKREWEQEERQARALGVRLVSLEGIAGWE